MDLGFAEEEDMLRDAVAQVLQKQCSFARVREIEESASGYDEALWQQLADLGMLGTFFPEEYGGAELPFIHTAIIMEELGKLAIPSPYHSCMVQAGLMILEGGSEAQKEALLVPISEGELLVSPVLYEPSAGYGEEDVAMEAASDGDGYRLNGTKMFAPDANIANKLIVAARIAEGVTLFLVDSQAEGVTVNKVPTVSMDNICEVVFENVAAAEVLGEKGKGWQLVEQMMGRSAVAKAAEMVGGCKTALEMTVSYSKEREQYGRPIGGYQVLQHYMSNMLMAYETSFNYLYKVVWLIDTEQDSTAEAAALKAYVNERYKFISERAIQIFGGIGTTRECDISLFYRRAKSCEFAGGDTRYHYETIAQKIGL